MTQSKTILISTLATSLLVLAGCTTQSTTNTNVVSNTNTTVNTNTANDNTNAVVTNSNENANEVVNENTNADQGSEVDTSDWLTYENEEYGFSFRYPSSATVNHLDINHWSIEGDNQLTVLVAVNDQDYQTAVNEKPVEASITEQRELIINGLTATLQIGMGADLGNDSNTKYPFTIYILPFNNKTLNFSIDSQNKQSQVYLEQIISTLR